MDSGQTVSDLVKKSSILADLSSLLVSMIRRIMTQKSFVTLVAQLIEITVHERVQAVFLPTRF